MLSKPAKNLLEEVNKLKDMPKEEAYPILDFTFFSYIHTVEDALYYSRKNEQHLLLLLKDIFTIISNANPDIRKRIESMYEELSDTLKRDYEE